MKIAQTVFFLLMAGKEKLFLCLKTVSLTNSCLLDPEWGSDMTSTWGVPVPVDRQTDWDVPRRTCSAGLGDLALSLPSYYRAVPLSPLLPLPNLLTLSSPSSSPLYLTPVVISSILRPSIAPVRWGLPSWHPSPDLSSAPLPTSPSPSITSPLDASQPPLKQNAWSSPGDSTECLPVTVKSISILPGVPAKDHGLAPDAFSFSDTQTTVYQNICWHQTISGIKLFLNASITLPSLFHSKGKPRF